MKQWHGIMRDVLERGEPRADRTGVGTLALFGVGCEFDLREGFPAVTTKRFGFSQMAGELSAFLAGAESLDEFHAHGCTLWDGNAAESPSWLARARFPGDVGRIYGVQWRRWRSWKYIESSQGQSALTSETDQLRMLIEGLRREPHGRRHLVTAWNPGELNEVCLPACHAFFQCFASDKDGAWLDLQFYMRSVDLFLGLPFDIASYALLTHLIGRATGRKPRRLVMHAGDAHIYLNHMEAARLALSRQPLYLSRLELSADCRGPNDFMPLHARLINYQFHDPIPAKLNV